MIQLQSVSKRYGPGGRRAQPKDLALADFSLRVQEGEAWTVAGPNGAGKTTLFSLLLGFLRPSAGEITIAGLAPRDYARSNGVGFLPEQFQLPPSWPVRDALTGLARLEGLGGDARDRAAAWLDRLGLTEHADKRFGALSRGLRQRLGLAQALLARRRLIVLDEPTEGLDPLWRVRLRELIAEARQDGATVLTATHDLAEAERFADHVVVLDRGRLVEVMESAARAEPNTYRIRLAEPSDGVAQAFGGATEQPRDDRASHPDGVAYTVHVESPADLSARLAALLDSGARLLSVTPVSQPLEERVRRALTESD